MYFTFQVLVKADKVYRRMENLECFKNVEIFIDTSKGPKASPNGIEVCWTNNTQYILLWTYKKLRSR